MNRKSCAIKFLVIVALVSAINSTPTSINAPPVTKNSIEPDKDDLKNFLGHCLHKSDVAKCLKHRIVDLMDEVIDNEDDWSVNFFNIKMSLKKNREFKESGDKESGDTGRTFEDIISQRLKSLMESRVFQMKLADDGSSSEVGASQEARKKKEGKHGHMVR
jgi:Protein of unknown function (DUF1676)